MSVNFGECQFNTLGGLLVAYMRMFSFEKFLIYLCMDMFVYVLFCKLIFAAMHLANL